MDNPNNYRGISILSCSAKLFKAILTKRLDDFLKDDALINPVQIGFMTDFSDQFRKIIMRYKRIGYNLNVMRQSACLVINPITVDSYAALFNCTPVDRASDSMMAPT